MTIPTAVAIIGVVYDRAQPYCKGETVMKKYIAILVCMAALLTAGILCASAATQESGYWVENAKNIDEILAGEAGEREVGWEVPFLHIQPTIDGEIGKTEYMPFEICVNTKEVKNTLLEDGKIYLDYVVEIRGAQAERTLFTIEITEETPINA